ncbi:uridine kinase [Terribacillus saccharophilus]|uniref:uridine/cytidine kinase n=1 Tax=Terribacillus saccharophilus TaxID=361277 RepID=A0ABX4H0T4_9BACI|nr:uridine kinase [Terribacillus saccharophilus]PAD36316.1 uridine kinase [Terribacillus saccharophilus]PAD95042.1 uridine kinase [Terribacillus saccharophilus]PAE00735.1 uridine kinase [Terribacillus saccharophilus]
MKPFILGISGGSCSGKTQLSDSLQMKLGKDNVLIISQDNYYIEPNVSKLHEYNFDTPQALDLRLLYENLKELSEGKSSRIPRYDFVTSTREGYTEVRPTPIIIVEGILLFHDQKIQDLCNLKLYLDADADTRLVRRILRDTSERNRTLDSILLQYERSVKKMHNTFVEPLKDSTDIVINSKSGSLQFFVDMISMYFRQTLNLKNLEGIS